MPTLPALAQLLKRGQPKLKRSQPKLKHGKPKRLREWQSCCRHIRCRLRPTLVLLSRGEGGLLRLCRDARSLSDSVRHACGKQTMRQALGGRFPQQACLPCCYNCYDCLSCFSCYSC